MGEDDLRLYRALSMAPFPKSYMGKVFLVAFLGTHVPLLALLAYLARVRRFGPRATLRILSVTVPATSGSRGASGRPSSARICLLSSSSATTRRIASA